MAGFLRACALKTGFPKGPSAHFGEEHRAYQICSMYNLAFTTSLLVLTCQLRFAASSASLAAAPPGCQRLSQRQAGPFCDILFGKEGFVRLFRGMAFFRLEAKVFGREKRGKSVVAAAAYRSGKSLHDDRGGKTYDYTRKSVEKTEIVAPEGAPTWATNSQDLWSAVEGSEKRVDAQLAREFILAVPPELSADGQFQLAKDWVKSELVSRGMVAEISLHHPNSGTNPHCHVLCTLRKLEGDHFSAKKPREWNDVGLLVKQRESWAAAVNSALEKAGRNERVDHRSLKDQGIDRLPQPKLGSAAIAMKQRGVVEDPERFQLFRRVNIMNQVRSMIKAVKQRGEVHQVGVGKTWWQKSISYMKRVRDEAEKAVKKSQWNHWRNRSRGAGKEGPEMSL